MTPQEQKQLPMHDEYSLVLPIYSTPTSGARVSLSQRRMRQQQQNSMNWWIQSLHNGDLYWALSTPHLTPSQALTLESRQFPKGGGGLVHYYYSPLGQTFSRPEVQVWSLSPVTSPDKQTPIQTTETVLGKHVKSAIRESKKQLHELKIPRQQRDASTLMHSMSLVLLPGQVSVLECGFRTKTGNDSRSMGDKGSTSTIGDKETKGKWAIGKTKRNRIQQFHTVQIVGICLISFPVHTSEACFAPQGLEH